MRARALLISSLLALLLTAPAALFAAPTQDDGAVCLADFLGQAGGVPGMDPYAGEAKPRFVISIMPQIMGPALVTGEVEPFLGGGISFCFNFVRTGAMSFGVDFEEDIGVAFETGGGSDTLDGKWFGTSIGFPLRVGKTASFLLRPGICFDVLDYYSDGYEWDWDHWDHWEDEASDVGVGIVVGVGFEINIRAFGIGFFFTARFLPVAHEVQEWWNGMDDGVHSGWLTIHAGMRFLIRF